MSFYEPKTGSSSSGEVLRVESTIYLHSELSCELGPKLQKELSALTDLTRSDRREMRERRKK